MLKYRIVAIAVPSDNPPDNIIRRPIRYIDDSLIRTMRVHALYDEPTVAVQSDSSSGSLAVNRYGTVIERANGNRIAAGAAETRISTNPRINHRGRPGICSIQQTKSFPRPRH